MEDGSLSVTACATETALLGRTRRRSSLAHCVRWVISGVFQDRETEQSIKAIVIVVEANVGVLVLPGLPWRSGVRAFEAWW